MYRPLGPRAMTPLERSFSRAFIAAVKSVHISLDDIAAGVYSPDLSDLVASLEASLPPILAAQYIDIANRAINLLVPALHKADPTPTSPAYLASLGIGFDLHDERAVTWAIAHAGKLIKDFEYSSREIIASIIAQSLAEGLTVDATATLIRGQLGLSPRLSKAATNYLLNLLEQPGMTQNIAGGLYRKYTDRLLRYRSTLIARTEIMTAANAGRLAGWNEAAGLGLFNPQDAKKQWQAAAAACSYCVNLDGFEVPVHMPFPDGQEMPPAHPACRCTAVLILPDPSTLGQSLRPDASLTPDSPFVPPNMDAFDPAASIYPNRTFTRFEGESSSYRGPGVKYADDVTERFDDSQLQYSLWRDDPTREMYVDTLSDYKGSGFNNLNDALRGKYLHSPKTTKMQQTIDQAFDTIDSIGDDIIVYRGINEWGLKDLGGIDSFQPGSVFLDPAYMSTTLDPSFAMTKFGYHGVRLILRVPKEAKAIYMEHPAAKVGKPWEWEFLFPRGSRFRVTRVIKAGDDEVADYIVEADYIPPTTLRKAATRSPSRRRRPLRRPRSRRFTYTTGDLVKE